ncbi:LysR family transcriptional regulator [Halolactibacillus alkaliphilus]|uniref:LysR family transcriptional regulator n=1 Tax=Halolactibacillus alkaliphilus TaxID=442899 RepID=A0A511X4L1_9BACI|nr:LysR family transcriptional regulator [Halolactibacillus alkaliphilus]GEN57890.1 LysR family transcriptional regulator [Halolactibacillus alkaliphilus]GGN75649.1 LysR family transcriptional regulator [Halolactibacillus alkaliphilus]SFP08517.1 DNA-binding transcriptional regulator, LysR family [Halolactibacillus alkaliphilus]
MTLQQLKYFIETVKHGSINKAAERLFIAQPSLSSALKELEAEIGQELFIRTPRGISLTTDGAEFLGYARQVVEQQSLLEQRWLNKTPSRRLCAISTQHYAFAVNAFVNMVKKTDAIEYEYTLREARTFEIVEDVKHLRSELGIIYKSKFNTQVIDKLLKENHLLFHPLFTAKPHVFVSSTNPLSQKKRVSLADLEDYPRLSYEQGEFNSFYFSEEILSTEYVKKDIKVGDRATIFNLMIGLNGYTISSGIVSADLNGDNIVAVPLDVDDDMTVGYITHKDFQLTQQAALYVTELIDVIKAYDVDVKV